MLLVEPEHYLNRVDTSTRVAAATWRFMLQKCGIERRERLPREIGEYRVVERRPFHLLLHRPALTLLRKSVFIKSTAAVGRLVNLVDWQSTMTVYMDGRPGTTLTRH